MSGPFKLLIDSKDPTHHSTLRDVVSVLQSLDFTQAQVEISSGTYEESTTCMLQKKK